MTKAKKYSLWLIPSGNVYNKLARIISQLSKEYATPNFEPHITLLADLIGPEEEISSKTSQLATLLRPFEIRLTEAGYHNEYFKCLFIKVEETEQLIDANLKAREIFNRQQDPKYLPHLSLMYGNFTSTIKEEIIAKIGRKFNMEFEVKTIHLFTSGEPKSWHRVKEFTLK